LSVFPAMSIDDLDFDFENISTKIIMSQNIQKLKVAGEDIGPIEEGKDFSEYINHWRNTFGYNQPGEIEKATNAYGITMFSDEELDYIFSFTDSKQHTGYINEFNDFERVKEVFFSHLDTIKKEKPDLAEKLESHFNFQTSTIEDSLQMTSVKDRK